MAHVTLYRKYRPQTFSEILGQEHVSTTLSNAIREDRVAHAYLFTGPRGTGKTSTARILAKALNCEKGPTAEPCGVCHSCVAIAEGSSLDVIEMDAASHSKVEETREILAGVPLAAAGGSKKVYVIDEVHMMSQSAFNALLKTLEEPPPHVVFVLATTEAHRVLPTIVSRTQRFDFRRVPVEVLEDHVASIAKQEGIEIDGEAVSLIARHADGGVRDALSVLDQLSSWGGAVTAEDVAALLGGQRDDRLVGLFDAVAASDVGAVFAAIATAVQEGADARQLAIGVLEHARSLLYAKSVPDADPPGVPPELTERLGAQAEAFSSAALLRIMDLVGQAWTEMRNLSNHRLLLELALVRAADPTTDASPGAILARIERLERRAGIDAPAPTELRDAVAARAPVPAATPVSPTTPGPSRSPAPATPAKKPMAPAEATPEASPPAPAAPGEIGLGHVKDAWDATLKEVNKRSRRIGALLNPSAPVQLDGDVLIVEVQAQFHADNLSDERSGNVISEGVYAALGVRLDLRFVARGTAPAPIEEETAEAAADAAPIEEDPVELVKKGLAAEVVSDAGGGKS